MCGIAGILTENNKNLDWYSSNLLKMNNEMLHRGPDDSGIWINNFDGIGLCHRRLSIIEISKLGHQPMISNNKKSVISYNGEIYNHLDLRKKLQNEINIVWKSTSDTETLIECLNYWGIDKTLSLLNGMFAFAFWDNYNKKLTLARDAFGEKPLYFGWVDSTFLFASDLSVFKKLDFFNPDLNKQSIDSLTRFSYIPSPNTIYKNFYKLEQGSYLTIDGKSKIKKIDIKKNQLINTNTFKLKKWYELKSVYNNSNKDQISDYDQAKKLVKKTLENSIEERLLSDVEVGTLLSGGIDSSLITSIMSKISNKKIKTFTMGFTDTSFDESETAKMISNSLNSEHHSYKITDNELINVVYSLNDIYSEPFADSSQIPTYILTSKVSENVKVALSGDGGDEFFGGYNRYIWGKQLWNKLSYLNSFQKKILVFILRNTPIKIWEIIEYLGNNLIDTNISQLNDKINRLANKIQMIENIDDLYLSLVNELNKNENLVIDRSFDETILKNIDLPKSLQNNIEEKMMFLDASTYLSDDILCKVDRAAMKNSLEVRVPFLSKDVVELSYKIPTYMKIHKNVNKRILRDIAYDYIPSEILNKPKKGFGIPLSSWLREGPLNLWSKDLINSHLKNMDGILDIEKVELLWNNHLSGKRDWHNKLWPILVFISWHKHN